MPQLLKEQLSTASSNENSGDALAVRQRKPCTHYNWPQDWSNVPE